MRPSSRLLAVCSSALVGLAFGHAHAANELCGQTITASVTLTADQSCTGDGLVVVGEKITIDLGGFTLSGDGDDDDDGIDVSGAGQVVIRNGTIRNFGFGIVTRVSVPELVKVSKVTVRDNAVSGLRASARLLVIDKCSALNNLFGINATGDTVKITATAAIGNILLGISLDAETATVTKVLAMGNGARGFSLGSGGSKVVIKSSQFVRNASDGLLLAEAPERAGTLVLAKNRIIGNGGAGVVTSGGDDPNHIVGIQITGNLIAGNADGGVRLAFDSDGSVISGNRIVGNEDDAVEIDPTSDGAFVKRNAMVGNSGAGIRTENGTATLTKNVLTANDNAIVAPMG